MSQIPTGELQPVGGEWGNAPFLEPYCQHQNVVAARTVNGEPGSDDGGKIAVYCFRCEEVWWEDLSNIVGTPWAE